MSWKNLLATDNNVWRGVDEYASERIADLTSICIAPNSSDVQIRQAQAAILELQRLKSLPAELANEMTARQGLGRRKEY